VEGVFISEIHGLINQRHFDQFDGNTIEDIDFSDALGIVQEKTITSIVCHSQAVKKSNFLASALALYLVGSGTKRRVVETLSGLGICYSYHQANCIMNRIARESEVRIEFSTNF